MTTPKKTSENESFATRWSRRKSAVKENEQNEEFIQQQVVEPDEPDLEQVRADKQAALNALTDEDMPAIESLNEQSDYAQFMSTHVSEALRKVALNKLFHSKTYNIRDGLDEYDGDYTSFVKLDPDTITCDMQHLMELEAEKLKAKLAAQMDEDGAQGQDNSNDAMSLQEGVDELDKKPVLADDASESLNERPHLADHDDTNTDNQSNDE